MKAAHGASPMTSSTWHSNGHPHTHSKSSVKNGMKQKSRGHKMVMPPFLRLNSTGEVSPCEPVRSVGQHKTRVDCQGPSNGLLGGLISNYTPNCTSRQLTMSQVHNGISALDELYKSRQVMDSPAKAGLRPHVKTAHSYLPWSDRYGQWGVSTYQHCAVLPPGVFPCHVFHASRTQNSLWTPSSGHFVHNPMRPSGQSLVDKVKQNFSSGSVHSNPAHRNHRAKAPSGIIDDPASCRVPKAASPCTVKKPNTTASAVFSSQESENTENGAPSVTQAASVIGTGLCEPAAVAVNQISLEHQPSASSESGSTVIAREVGCVQNQISQREKSMDKMSVHNSPSSAGRPVENNVEGCSSAYSANTNRISEGESADRNVCDRDKNRGGEDTNGLCWQVFTHHNGSSIKMHTPSDNLPSRFFITTAFQMQPSVDEVDWDDTDDECEETDQECLTDTLDVFMEFTLSNLLSGPCREKHCLKGDREEKKTRPAPCPAVTRRWNKLYPADPQEHRPSKVQFSCGADIDEVHLFERAEGEALTVMEIQKARDLSKQNKGKAGKLLQTKNFLEDLSEMDTSGESVKLPCDVDTDCGDVCDGRTAGTMEASSLQNGTDRAVTTAVMEREGGCQTDGAVKISATLPHSQESGSSIALDFDASDFEIQVFQGGSVSSDWSEDEDGTDSESEEDDGHKSDDDDDDDVVFE